MYFKKVPSFFFYLFPYATWRITNQEKVYLTFDDGPDPDTTPALLDTLDQLGIKANFFCLGHKAASHPELITKIVDRGHLLGHHGYDHLSGWSTDCDTYLLNVNKSSLYIDSIFYRPPYGRMTYKQYKTLSQKYKIIMWDNMPGDFDTKVNDQLVLNNLRLNTTPGSIIAMHDTVDSWAKNQNILSDYSNYIDTLSLDFGLLSEVV